MRKFQKFFAPCGAIFFSSAKNKRFETASIYHAYSYESDLESKINFNFDIGLGDRFDFDKGKNYFGAFYKLNMKAKITSKCAISLEGSHDIVGKSGAALFSDIKAYAKVAFNDRLYAKFGVEKAGLLNEFS